MLYHINNIIYRNGFYNTEIKIGKQDEKSKSELPHKSFG